MAAAYADSGDDAAMDECQPRSQPCISSEASHLLRFRFVAERARHGQATPRGCEQPAGIIAACGQAQAPRGDCDGRAKHSPGRRSTLVGPLLAPKTLGGFRGSVSKVDAGVSIETRGVTMDTTPKNLLRAGAHNANACGTCCLCSFRKGQLLVNARVQRRSRLEIESGGVWVRVPIKTVCLSVCCIH